ncbi:MAG: hypothetical protein OXE41_06080, partial [Gammaproteobacteria bacterium]|nr:hypothetical protein [Gammaproteobacteria bacterium]
LEEFDFDTQEKLGDRISELSIEEIQLFYETRILNNLSRLVVQSTGNDLQGPIQGNFLAIESASSLN